MTYLCKMLRTNGKFISMLGKYIGLGMALLLLNLTALADDLNSLSFDHEPGYYQPHDNVRGGCLGEMIADNVAQFSNSVPKHQERLDYSATVGDLTSVDFCFLKFFCPTILAYRDRVYSPMQCLENRLCRSNSPPLA